MISPLSTRQRECDVPAAIWMGKQQGLDSIASFEGTAMKGWVRACPSCIFILFPHVYSENYVEGSNGKRYNKGFGVRNFGVREIGATLRERGR